jgi:MFS-type transporter involved in bile tolerance (Atg22 family)
LLLLVVAVVRLSGLMLPLRAPAGGQCTGLAAAAAAGVLGVEAAGLQGVQLGLVALLLLVAVAACLAFNGGWLDARLAQGSFRKVRAQQCSSMCMLKISLQVC